MHISGKPLLCCINMHQSFDTSPHILLKWPFSFYVAFYVSFMSLSPLYFKSSALCGLIVKTPTSRSLFHRSHDSSFCHIHCNIFLNLIMSESKYTKLVLGFVRVVLKPWLWLALFAKRQLCLATTRVFCYRIGHCRFMFGL